MKHDRGVWVVASKRENDADAQAAGPTNVGPSTSGR